MKYISQWFTSQLDKLRIHLAHPDALVQLTLLGLVSGVLTGSIITLFRVLVEDTQLGFLPGGMEGNYEALEYWQRFLLPVVGGLLIGLIFKYYSKGLHVLGVARVMERMSYHQGYLTLRGFFLQFTGAAIAIISGHSVGREGPNVYLGAAASSLFGQWLSLPNNSIRIMVGCGTAAGIAASFNTPLAGVIFALEVVIMEYTIASFIPVIIAAVSATSISNLVFGNQPAFLVFDIQMDSLIEILPVLLLGFVVGTVSAVFIELMQRVTVSSQVIPFCWRTVLAGFIVGCIALFFPQVMGIGYDTVRQAITGELGMLFLIALVVFKLLATVASVGLGIPGGMIGPSLFIGACVGSLLGSIINLFFPELSIHIGFYTLLGMGAMMGASLQAPLAALTAMMELTYSPQIIMPGMLVIVVANLTASELFGKESLFITMLKANDLDYNANPVTQTLRRIGVASLMSKQFICLKQYVSPGDIDDLLKENPQWLLIETEKANNVLMPAVDLVRYMGHEEAIKSKSQEDSTETEINLLEIPAERLQASAINIQASLEEALEVLEHSIAEALYVERSIAPGIQHVYGILTRKQIESAYRY